MVDAKQLHLDAERAFRFAGGRDPTRQGGRYRIFSDAWYDLGRGLYGKAPKAGSEIEGGDPYPKVRGAARGRGSPNWANHGAPSKVLNHGGVQK
jgi:hypothetical protein